MSLLKVSLSAASRSETPQADRSPVVSQAAFVKEAPRWQEVKAPHGIGYRFKLVSQLMGRKFQKELDPHGLTLFHWVVLCCLWEQDGLATSDLGDRLCQVGGTLTGVIDRMEERGLVQRQRDPNDRRVWRIWLTESGRTLETVLIPLAAELRAQALRGLSDAEQQLFSEWLDVVIENLS